MAMNIRDEELLYRYFERQMSTAEEQNFLIDVAARDDMRVAFRSQLELLKAVRRDKDAIPGVAFVRERTLGALGFAGVVLPSANDEEAVAAVSNGASSKWGALLRKPMAFLSGGLLVGSIATYSIMNTVKTEEAVPATVGTPSPTEIRITMPPLTAPAAEVQNTSQTQPASNALKVETHKTAGNTNMTNNAKPADLNPPLPLVHKSAPLGVTVNPPRIRKPGETK